MDGDVQLEVRRTIAFFLLCGSYSSVLVLTVSSFSTAVSPPSVQVVVMATLQETAMTWHTINARSHTAVMEYSAGCIWDSVCDSLPQRGGIFFFSSFFFFFSRKLKTARHRDCWSQPQLQNWCMYSVFEMIHSQSRHGGVLWQDCRGLICANCSKLNKKLCYNGKSCCLKLSRANCTCKQARRAEESQVCTML